MRAPSSERLLTSVLCAVLAVAATVFFCLFLGGCQPQDHHQLPRQQEATAIVWVQTYAESAPAPDVAWVEQPQLDCHVDADNDFDGYLLGDGVCAGGDFRSYLYLVALAHPDAGDGWRYSGGAFAHEFWHAALFLRDGYGHPAHDDPGFGTAYGYPPGATDDADAALRAAGL